MKLWRFIKKPFVTGMFAGAILLLLLEWGLLFAVARYHTLSPEQLKETLKSPPIPSTLEADYRLPLKTMEGTPFDFAQLKGKTVVLTMWSPHCSVCKAELPSLQKLMEKTQGSTIAFVLAATKGTPAEIEEVLSELAITAPVYRIDGEIPKMYRSNIPATFILSPEGKLAFRHDDPAQWDGEGTVAFLHKLAATPPELKQ